LDSTEYARVEARNDNPISLGAASGDERGKECVSGLLFKFEVDERCRRHGSKGLGERGYTKSRQLNHEELSDTPWQPEESIERLIVHDDRYPIGTEAHIKLHTIALRRACDEGGEAVLTDRFIVSPAMRKEERALEGFTCATDRARAKSQEAAPAAGSVIVNVVPTPVVEVTVISPP
jgi:hypothetical protein